MSHKHNNFTRAFKDVIDRYKKETNPKQNIKWTIQMILEERNKQFIDQQKLEDIIREDVINTKNEVIMPDSHIAQKYKYDSKQNKNKKIQKDNIIKLLYNEEESTLLPINEKHELENPIITSLNKNKSMDANNKTMQKKETVRFTLKGIEDLKSKN
jgi:hypothetical protein